MQASDYEKIGKKLNVKLNIMISIIKKKYFI